MTRNAANIAVSAEEDRTQIIFEGEGDNRLACDTTLRGMPDGSWAMIMLGFGHAVYYGARLPSRQRTEEGQP